MRQIVLDTETTGLEVSAGHRIIEIGAIELLNRRPSGQQFHRYLNPERQIDAGATAVHGITTQKLATAPKFAEVALELMQFLRGAELVIHNAPFDVGFLDMELTRAAALLGTAAEFPSSLRDCCQVLDTLALARARHPGQRNNLDALCKRYHVDGSGRELHGALLDARLLADVYLAMTGGQSALALDEVRRERTPQQVRNTALLQPVGALRVVEPTAQELAAHAQLRAVLQKASGQCLWQRLEDADAVS